MKTKKILQLLAHLESAYSLIWGGHRIWEEGSGVQGMVWG